MSRALPIWKLTDPDGSLRASAPVVLVRLQELLDLAESARDPENVEALHDLRIAAKRLRYTLEIFAPALGAEAEGLLSSVEALQERLGDIHDLDVRLVLLRKALARERTRERKKADKRHPVPVSAEIGLLPLADATEADRSARFDAFLALWDSLPPESFAADLTRLVSGGETILGD